MASSPVILDRKIMRAEASRPLKANIWKSHSITLLPSIGQCKLQGQFRTEGREIEVLSHKNNSKVLLPRRIIQGCERLSHPCLQETYHLIGISWIMRNISFSSDMKCTFTLSPQGYVISNPFTHISYWEADCWGSLSHTPIFWFPRNSSKSGLSAWNTSLPRCK